MATFSLSLSLSLSLPLFLSFFLSEGEEEGCALRIGVERTGKMRERSHTDPATRRVLDTTKETMHHGTQHSPLADFRYLCYHGCARCKSNTSHGMNTSQHYNSSFTGSSESRLHTLLNINSSSQLPQSLPALSVCPSELHDHHIETEQPTK